MTDSGLSVCMIVRNEETVLQRCLDSLAGLYDELCIVDTGSSDDTVAVARRNGAIVGQCLDCNDQDGLIVDFARPRNVALSLASREWVLQIDADEVLLSGRDTLRLHVDQGAYDTVGTVVRSGGAEWYSVRLFKRCSAGQYVSPIHEYVELAGSFVRAPDIVIENLPNKEGKESSFDRNVRLALLSLKDNPDEGRTHHYLGNEYRKAGKYQEAIKSYEAALAAGNFTTGLFHSAYYLGSCHMIVGNWAAAEEAAERAVAINSGYAEGHCLIADALYCAGKLAEAKEHYLSALNCQSPPPTMLPTRAEAYGPYPKAQLQRLADRLNSSDAQ